MKKYDTYKDSGNQWIGQVPEHWCLYSLKYYLNLQKGRKPEEFLEEGDLPYVTMDYIRSRENKTCLYPSSTEGLVPINDDDMLVLWDGANAGEIVKAKKGFLSSTMAVLDFDKKIGLSQYLFYLLKKMEPTFKTFANGTTIPHFDSSILLDYKYPLPPLSEQQAIVEYLAKKTGQIDQSIALLETQKTDLQAYRQALITETVTKGLNPHAPMKDSGMQWIGEIPEGWKVFPLKRYAMANSGKEIPAEIDSDSECAIPVYGSGGIFKYTNQVMYSGEAVMFGRKGTIGKPLYVNTDFWTVDTMYYITFDKSKLLPKYNYYQFLVFDWGKYTTQTALPSIVAADILKCEFSFPPLSEQQDIVEYLDKKTSNIDAALKQIDTQIADLQAYRTALISEAVTGKIDVRNQ